jgi:hypothetical protein
LLNLFPHSVSNKVTIVNESFQKYVTHNKN